MLITGDVKYHDARDAQMLGLALVDMGHFASEKVMIKGIVSALAVELAERGFAVETLPCETESDPFVFL